MGPHAARIMGGWSLDLLGTRSSLKTSSSGTRRTGALLNTVPLKRGARIRYGSPYLTLLRADLQKALLARANELEIPIHYGAPVLRPGPWPQCRPSKRAARP